MMTSLYINCNMPPPDWSSIEGKGGGEGGRQAVTERSERKKIKIKKNKIKAKKKQNKYKKREKIVKEIKEEK